MNSSGFNPKSRQSLFALIGEVPGQVGELVRAELEALKADLASKAKNLGVGVGLFAAAGAFAFFSAGVFVALAVVALALVLPLWLATLIVGVLLLVIALILVLIGINRVKVGTTPDREGGVGSRLRHDVDAFKGVGEYEH